MSEPGINPSDWCTMLLGTDKFYQSLELQIFGVGYQGDLVRVRETTMHLE